VLDAPNNTASFTIDVSGRPCGPAQLRLALEDRASDSDGFIRGECATEKLTSHFDNLEVALDFTTTPTPPPPPPPAGAPPPPPPSAIVVTETNQDRASLNLANIEHEQIRTMNTTLAQVSCRIECTSLAAMEETRCKSAFGWTESQDLLALAPWALG
jgi:hypothetical protein